MPRNAPESPSAAEWQRIGRARNDPAVRPAEQLGICTWPPLRARRQPLEPRSRKGFRAESKSLGLVEPELQSHAAEHLDRMFPGRAGLVSPPLGMVKRGQAEVAASFERSHLERPGHR